VSDLKLGRLVPAAALVFAVIASCGGEGDVHFTTNLASDFVPTRHAISVLGVYKDGRMSPDGWEALGPRITTALRATSCESGYDRLASTNVGLADAINEYTRADGPTDDLLALLAPAAQGDLVLVLTFAGKLPQHGGGDAGAMPPPSGGPSLNTNGGGGRMSMRGPGGRRQHGPEAPRDTNVLDVSASLFSVAQHTSVALVGMEYSGTSIDDALVKFAAKLAQTLPIVTCVGWNWEATVDPEKIRQSIDQ
jgi:hypothetical protein